jgi:hypothetical protein
MEVLDDYGSGFDKAVAWRGKAGFRGDQERFLRGNPIRGDCSY